MCAYGSQIEPRHAPGVPTDSYSPLPETGADIFIFKDTLKTNTLDHTRFLQTRFSHVFNRLAGFRQ